jgi:hypothetical protein
MAQTTRGLQAELYRKICNSQILRQALRGQKITFEHIALRSLTPTEYELVNPGYSDWIVDSLHLFIDGEEVTTGFVFQGNHVVFDTEVSGAVTLSGMAYEIKCYQLVPKDPVYPYIDMGELRGNPDDTFAKNGETFNATFFVLDGKSGTAYTVGTARAHDIKDALRDVLEGDSFSLEDSYVVYCKYDGFYDYVDRDVIQTAVRFVIWTRKK